MWTNWRRGGASWGVLGACWGVWVTVGVLLGGVGGQEGALEEGSLPPFNFQHRIILDHRGNYLMMWTPEEEGVTVEIQVATKGYIGLGFSHTGGMKGADVVLGWVSEGKVYLEDRHAFGQLTPAIDASQDYRLLGGHENDTHTTLRLYRPWTTCDDHDYQLEDDTVRVIWSYDAHDPAGEDEGRLRKHDQRGSRSLYLRHPQPRPSDTKPASPVRYWDVLAPEVELPPRLSTLYWCKLYRVPDLSRKTHVIGYVPKILPENAQHVHHMLLYECHITNADKLLQKFVSAKGGQCYDENMPVSWLSCNTAIVAWAIGSEGEMLPSSAGIPLGEEHGGATYFMLEIHYDNPELRQGVVDSSGVRLLYTEELREHDAGVLTLGHTVSPTMIIPPGRHWTTVAHCTSACTEKTIPREGIKVFQGVLHAHLLGAAITVQHIRNDTELPPIIKDNHYDFNYQQSRVFQEPRVVLPGDSMIVSCGYDSTKRHSPTFGGFSTMEEMCLAFLTYYPRSDLAGCYSKPDIALLLDTFGITDLYDNDLNLFEHKYLSDFPITAEEEDFQLRLMEAGRTSQPQGITLAHIYGMVTVKEPEKYHNKTFYEILHDPATWHDPTLAPTLQQMVTQGQHEPSCEYHGRQSVQGLPKKSKYPHYQEYQPQPKTCTTPPPPTTTTTATTTTTTTTTTTARTTIKTTGNTMQSPISTKSTDEFEGLTATPSDAVTLPDVPQEENEVERDNYVQKDSATTLSVSACASLLMPALLSLILLQA